MGVSIYEASLLATNRTRWRNTVRHMGCQRALTTSLSPRQCQVSHWVHSSTNQFS